MSSASAAGKDCPGAGATLSSPDRNPSQTYRFVVFVDEQACGCIEIKKLARRMGLA